MRQDLSALNDALKCDDDARQTFVWIGENYQQEFLGWIKSAMTEYESSQRVQVVVDMLAGRDVVRRN